MKPLIDGNIPRMTARRASIGFANGKPSHEGRHTWYSRPDLPFKPLGMMVWGATALTRIHNIMIGNRRQHIISRETCPARLFAAPLGFIFADFVKLMENKPTDGTFLEHWHYFHTLMTDFPKGSEPHLVGLDTAQLGVMITIEYVGPMTDLAMWGLTVASEG